MVTGLVEVSISSLLTMEVTATAANGQTATDSRTFNVFPGSREKPAFWIWPWARHKLRLTIGCNSPNGITPGAFSHPPAIDSLKAKPVACWLDGGANGPLIRFVIYRGGG